VNKCQVLSEREIVFKDISVEEMMQVISDNQDKSIIETFNVEYSNLEAAYLNLLREKERKNNV
ncbi:ABC transporter ATP-binding protein, partial [Streptococcus agalactiae]|nr:ABC transporter ATP-binding protein [Streptococcus agalactiae]